MCFFSISCLTKSWKLWLDHAEFPVRMASDSGLVRRTAVRFQHFRRGTFWYTATSLCDSKSISWAKRNERPFWGSNTVWRLKEGSKSPTFRRFFLGDDDDWFLTGGWWCVRFERCSNRQSAKPNLVGLEGIFPPTFCVYLGPSDLPDGCHFPRCMTRSYLFQRHQGFAVVSMRLVVPRPQQFSNCMILRVDQPLGNISLVKQTNKINKPSKKATIALCFCFVIRSPEPWIVALQSNQRLLFILIL